MDLDRRDFFKLAAGALAAPLVPWAEFTHQYRLYLNMVEVPRAEFDVRPSHTTKLPVENATLDTVGPFTMNMWVKTPPRPWPMVVSRYGVVLVVENPPDESGGGWTNVVLVKDVS